MIRAQTPLATIRACPLCGSDNRHAPASPWSRDTWDVKECGECRFVFLENVLPYDALVQDHAWTHSSTSLKSGRAQTAPWRHAFKSRLNEFRWKVTRRDKVGLLVRTYIGSGTVLDLGCGQGEVLETLGKAFQPVGIEIDAAAVDAARQRVPQAQIHHASALAGLQQLSDETLDGVVMISYLEHENEPRAVLEQVRVKLKPTGVGIIKVPNFGSLNRKVRGTRWCGFRYPDHVNYFTPETLTQIVESAGLSVQRFALQDRLPTSDNMWMVIGRG